MVAQTIVSNQTRTVDLTAISNIDSEISRMPPVVSPVTGIFTKGLYTRTIEMPAGSAHRSKIHKTEHQFIISQGACFVSENGGPRILYKAPYHGITRPGTWRSLFIIMDCIWTTMHPTDKTTVEEVEADIIASMEEVKDEKA